MTSQRDVTTSEWFHTVQKGADGQDIFSATSHRTVYATLLADALERFGIELHAYAWMTNHVHQLVHAPDGGLADAMHRVGSRYASLYNGWTDRTGPLFTARYFSEPITSDAQLMQTARYIHRNPLVIVGAAGLVGYRWSSLGALCGQRPIPTWLSTGIVTTGFDADSYERHVLTPQPADRTSTAGLPALTTTSCAEIEMAIATVAGRSVADLRVANGKVSDHARTLMITLAVDFRAADSTSLADRYGLSDRRSVRRAARRGRTLATQSVDFAVLRNRVIAHLDTVAPRRIVVPGDPGVWNQRGSRRPGRGGLRRAG